MSFELFNRYYKLTISDDEGATIDYSELHCQFSVTSAIGAVPGICRLRLYNVNKERFDFFTMNGGFIELYAGYQGSHGIIFQGSITQVRDSRENGVDTYIDITAIDGDEIHNSAFVSTTYAPGSTASSRLFQLVKATNELNSCGYEILSPTKEQLDSFLPKNDPKSTVTFGASPLLRHKSVVGSFSKIVEKECKLSRIDTAITRRQGLQVLSAYTIVTDPDYIWVINYKTGQLDIPYRTSDGVVVKTLLNPNYVALAGSVHINNKSVREQEINVLAPNEINQQQAVLIKQNYALDGYYKIYQITNVGDTRGEDWYSELTCAVITNTDELAKLEAGKNIGNK